MTTTQRDIVSATRTATARETGGLPQVPRLAAALGMSLLLWLYVASIADPPNRIQYPSVPVEVRNLNQQLVRRGPAPTVSIEMRPIPGANRVTDTAPPSPYVDLAGLGTGFHVVPVRLEDTNNALSVEIQPPQVRVQLVPAMTATLPVQIGSESGTSSRLAADVQISPEQVTITGAEGDVDRVKAVRANVNWQTFVPGTTVSAPIIAVNEEGHQVNAVSISPPRVQVTLPPEATVTP